MSDRVWNTALCFLGGAFLGLAFTLSGCAPAQKVVHAAKAGATLARIAEPVLVAQYEAEQRACLELAEARELCVADVRKRWQPVKDAIADMHAAYCAVDELLDAELQEQCKQ